MLDSVAFTWFIHLYANMNLYMCATHVNLRLRRYFKPANGKSAASKEAAAMFDDKEKRIMAAFRMAQQAMICTYDPNMAHLISKESNWQLS